MSDESEEIELKDTESVRTKIYRVIKNKKVRFNPHPVIMATIMLCLIPTNNCIEINETILIKVNYTNPCDVLTNKNNFDYLWCKGLYQEDFLNEIDKFCKNNGKVLELTTRIMNSLQSKPKPTNLIEIENFEDPITDIMKQSEDRLTFATISSQLSLAKSLISSIGYKWAKNIINETLIESPYLKIEIPIDKSPESFEPLICIHDKTCKQIWLLLGERDKLFTNIKDIMRLQEITLVSFVLTMIYAGVVTYQNLKFKSKKILPTHLYETPPE